MVQPLLQLWTAQDSAGGAELCWLMFPEGSGNSNRLWLSWGTASLWALDPRPWVSPNCPGAWRLLPKSVMKLHSLQARAQFKRSIHEEGRKKGSASLGSLSFLKLTLHLSINLCDFNTVWLSMLLIFDMLRLYISWEKKLLREAELQKAFEGLVIHTQKTLFSQACQPSSHFQPLVPLLLNYSHWSRSWTGAPKDNSSCFAEWQKA